MSANISPTDTAPITDVVIHPLVLLSVADHYNRIAKDSQNRVVGVLLGNRSRGRVDISNSFAVPFEEHLNNPSVWFLDHNFLYTMYWMFKKVNSNEEIVGFYSSGPKVKENDLKISALFQQFCADPVFAIVDVRPGVEGIPTTAYIATEEVRTDGQEIQMVFKHLACHIEAEEAEEVGVEHLLRDINDPSTSLLAMKIRQKISGLTGLASRLGDIQKYLQNVIEKRIPMNHKVLYNLQDILNFIPNLNIEELVRSMLVKTNDMHLVMYLSSMVRSVIALHELLMNKIKYIDLDDVLDSAASGEQAKAAATTAPPTPQKEGQ